MSWLNAARWTIRWIAHVPHMELDGELQLSMTMQRLRHGLDLELDDKIMWNSGMYLFAHSPSVGILREAYVCVVSS